MLLVRHAHEETLHGGTQSTIRNVRQKYWISKLRTVARSVIHRCMKCRRQTGAPIEQQMAALPAVHVTPGRAFERSGVNYCGPFFIKARSGRCKTICKAYVAAFVCVATRVVHLELVSDLTAFVAALTRRGRVREFLSDNGRNFVCSDKELASTVNSWNKLPDDDMFRALHIEWTFIPPVAPHQTPYAQSDRRSATHFRRVTLTPGHFLIGKPLVTPLAPDYTSVPMNRLKRLVQDFWTRWKDECLDQPLLPRPKWKNEHTNAAVDDIVLIRSAFAVATGPNH